MLIFIRICLVISKHLKTLLFKVWSKRVSSNHITTELARNAEPQPHPRTTELEPEF